MTDDAAGQVFEGLVPGEFEALTPAEPAVAMEALTSEAMPIAPVADLQLERVQDGFAPLSPTDYVLGERVPAEFAQLTPTTGYEMGERVPAEFAQLTPTTSYETGQVVQERLAPLTPVKSVEPHTVDSAELTPIKPTQRWVTYADSKDLTDGYIHVDYSHMENAADDLVSQTQAIAKTVESLNAELGELHKTWVGDDGDVYREKQRAWNHA